MSRISGFSLDKLAQSSLGNDIDKINDGSMDAVEYLIDGDAASMISFCDRNVIFLNLLSIVKY